MQREEGNEKKRAAVITYNSVEGYPAGEYEGKNWTVTVYSHANTKTWGRGDAKSKLEEILRTTRGTLPDKVVIYAGLYALEGALNAASNLKNQGKEVNLVACDCGQEYKMQRAREMNVPILWSGCGGRRTLRKVVDYILNEAD